MTDLDEKELNKLAHLCRLKCTEEEKRKLLQSLKGIIKYIEQLKEVDTEGVSPCNHILETMTNVMREDEVKETLSRELFLENAPSHVGGMIKVPRIIKFD